MQFHHHAIVLLAISTLSGCYDHFSDTVLAVSNPNERLITQALQVTPDDELVLTYFDYQSSHYLKSSTSSDHGQTWSIPETIYDVRAQFSSKEAEVVAIGDSDFLVDMDNPYFRFASIDVIVVETTEPRKARDEHHFLYSSNKGQSWTRSHVLRSEPYERYVHTMLAQNPQAPTVVAYARTKQVGFERQVVAHISFDRGRTFLRNSIIRDTPPADYWLNPLDFTFGDDGTLLFFYSMTYWPDNGPSSVHFWLKRSTDFGQSWSSPIRINSSMSGDRCASGDLESVGTTVHATWSTDLNLKHAYSTDGGSTWSDNEILDWNSVQRPTLSDSPASPLVVLSYWMPGDSFETGNVRYRTFDGTWSPEKRVNNHLNAVHDFYYYGRQDCLAADQDGTFYQAFRDIRSLDLEPSVYHQTDIGVAATAAEYGPITSPVSVTLDESSTFAYAEPREKVGFEFRVTNHGAAAISPELRVSYESQAGREGVLRRWNDVQLEAGESTDLRYEIRLGPNPPRGKYHLRVSAEMLGSSAPETESFSVQVR